MQVDIREIYLRYVLLIGTSELDFNAHSDIKENPFTRHSNGSPVGSSYPLGLKTLNNRNHVFCKKTVIFFEYCNHCGKR
jgi:hypothetical protein